MSQEQARRSQAEEKEPQQQPIRYGDVFAVSGEIAGKPVTPRDAATMQAAESMMLGGTKKGGPAAVMQSAATENEKAGVVSHDAVTDIARGQGVSVAQSVVGDGTRVITEAVGDQVVAQYAVPEVATGTPGKTLDPDSISIGEALEAASLSIGDKPVDKSDAAAINAAEMRAMGTDRIQPGGIAATAESAAAVNERTLAEGAKKTISDVLAVTH